MNRTSAVKRRPRMSHPNLELALLSNELLLSEDGMSRQDYHNLYFVFGTLCLMVSRCYFDGLKLQFVLRITSLAKIGTRFKSQTCHG